MPLFGRAAFARNRLSLYPALLFKLGRNRFVHVFVLYQLVEWWAKRWFTPASSLSIRTARFSSEMRWANLPIARKVDCSYENGVGLCDSPSLSSECLCERTMRAKKFSSCKYFADKD